MSIEKLEQMKIEKRSAKEEDTEFARQVHHKAYHDVVVNQFGEWDDKMQDKFFKSGWKNSLHHEIILCDGVPCGYSSSEETDDLITFNELVILPEFQGRGIGTKILNEKIEKAKIKKIPARLQVLKANKAIDLYQKLGAEIIGETETHLKMEFDPNKNKQA